MCLFFIPIATIYIYCDAMHRGEKEMEEGGGSLELSTGLWNSGFSNCIKISYESIRATDLRNQIEGKRTTFIVVLSLTLFFLNL